VISVPDSKSLLRASPFRTEDPIPVGTKTIIPGSPMKQKNNGIANNHNTNSRDITI
jgi:hypothetical protein